MIKELLSKDISDLTSKELLIARKILAKSIHELKDDELEIVKKLLDYKVNVLAGGTLTKSLVKSDIYFNERIIALLEEQVALLKQLVKQTDRFTGDKKQNEPKKKVGRPKGSKKKD
jgi:hypothetical protein